MVLFYQVLIYLSPYVSSIKKLAQLYSSRKFLIFRGVGQFFLGQYRYSKRCSTGEAIMHLLKRANLVTYDAMSSRIALRDFFWNALNLMWF